MRPRDLVRRFATRPAWGTAVVAAALRVGLVLHAHALNPLVQAPQLDGEYYLRWARDIAGGDWAGRAGITGGEPWFLNPLYAYVLAPFAGLAAEPLVPVLLFQAILGAVTAALAAAAAARWFGRGGGWVAGALVTFAAPLAQLDAHIAVAELSAFFVAGAGFACAPATQGDRRAPHGPVAAGLWLGIGALARPVVPLALPLVAWRFARESPRRLRTALVVVAVFAACAVPSFLRNWLVSGDRAVYTAAGGINAHLGNNAEARKYRSMTSSHFRFSPVEMHADARRYVHEAIGRRPTRTEVGDWFWKMTVDECVRYPGESALHYANKARWFFEATEVPSSASLATDRGFAPWTRLAFVPTWAVACLAAAGAWACRRRRDLMLGPGALALAHWAMLVLVFPLSHYRAPAIPALAVLAAGAAVTVGDAWRSARRRTAVGVLGVAVGAAAVGAVPPGPDPQWFRDEAVLAVTSRDRGDLEGAEMHAKAGLEAFRRQWGTESGLAWEMIGEMQFRRREWPDAMESLTKSLALSPQNPFVRVMRSHVHERLGDFAAAEKDARDVIERHPLLPDGWGRLGELLSILPGREREARQAWMRAAELRALADAAAGRR